MDIQLRQLLTGKVVIVGIGNVLRGDDAFGPRLVERLHGNVRAVCLDAGTAPESYAGKILRENPDAILIVDAVSLDRPAGSYELIPKEEILRSGLTTHDLSPRLFLEYLIGKTKAEIFMLGVQPCKLEFGDDFTEPVQKTLDEIEKKIKEALPCTNPI